MCKLLCSQQSQGMSVLRSFYTPLVGQSTIQYVIKNNVNCAAMKRVVHMSFLIGLVGGGNKRGEVNEGKRNHM